MVWPGAAAAAAASRPLKTPLSANGMNREMKNSRSVSQNRELEGAAARFTSIRSAGTLLSVTLRTE